MGWGGGCSRPSPSAGLGPLAAGPVLLGRRWIRQLDRQRIKLTKAAVGRGPHPSGLDPGEITPRKATGVAAGVGGGQGAAGSAAPAPLACSFLAHPQPLPAALQHPRTGGPGASRLAFSKTKQLQPSKAQQRKRASSLGGKNLISSSQRWGCISGCSRNLPLN